MSTFTTKPKLNFWEWIKNSTEQCPAFKANSPEGYQSTRNTKPLPQLTPTFNPVSTPPGSSRKNITASTPDFDCSSLPLPIHQTSSSIIQCQFINQISRSFKLPNINSRGIRLWNPFARTTAWPSAFWEMPGLPACSSIQFRQSWTPPPGTGRSFSSQQPSSYP